jgi:hypothetical protein
MLIVWIRKSKPKAGETSEELTRRHNADMTRFKAGHPDWDVADARDIVTADGNLLAAVHGVRLHACSQN